MSITFDSPAEAFLAVAAVAIAADGVGSMVERKFLFERIKGMDLFQSYALAEFETMMNGVTHRVYESLPTQDMAITVQGVDTLIKAARAVLSADQQTAVVKMATELCHADGLSDEEKTLLEQLERGFSSKA
jgi:tellurite resistance protein